MSEEISEILARIALVALVLSFFADLVLRAAWNKIYFKIGLPIFLKRIPVATIHEGLPYQYLLEDEFQAGLLTPLTFKKLDSHTYGFREAYFHFPSIRYFPIMHGLLIFEKDRRQVIVKGFASWFSIWLIFLGLDQLAIHISATNHRFRCFPFLSPWSLLCDSVFSFLKGWRGGSSNVVTKTLHPCCRGLTQRAVDAGDSARFRSSFLRLSIFPLGRLRRARPSATNASR